jgi:hypothetical protein
MKNIFDRASIRSYQIGFMLCVIHLILSWWVIINICRSEPDAQWQLVWIFFLPFDLPFSLLVFFSAYLFPAWSFAYFPYPVSEFRSFILPSFIHGILGPIWYFLLPVCISSLKNRNNGDS